MSHMAKDKSKQKKKKKMKPFMRLVVVLLVVVGSGLLYRVGVEVYRAFDLKKQKQVAEVKLQEVQDQGAYLKTEREKLEDPNYVASYARGNYLLSKQDRKSVV